jgi:hypothetical protein
MSIFAFYSLSEDFPLRKPDLEAEPPSQTLYVGVYVSGSARG